ncbi:uncharacterized protein LOC107618924 isoform X1 [Arachis ipaensis]|nr:uncharacterized protein LOC107618924 isoform X1 [Arachis ipaensis]XP_025677381.1 uncharacterized protein LOC112777263 isoform X1 [Arachis hypogaea]
MSSSHRYCSCYNTTPPPLVPPLFLHVDAQDRRCRFKQRPPLPWKAINYSERGLQGRKRRWQEISPITSLHQGFFSMKSHFLILIEEIKCRLQMLLQVKLQRGPLLLVALLMMKRCHLILASYMVYEVECSDHLKQKLAENMIAHKEEIFSCPKRTWFVAETEKKVAAKAAKASINNDKSFGKVISAQEAEDLKMKKKRKREREVSRQRELVKS